MAANGAVGQIDGCRTAGKLQPTWHGCIEEPQLAVGAGRCKHQARGVPCHCLQQVRRAGPAVLRSCQMISSTAMV